MPRWLLAALIAGVLMAAVEAILPRLFGPGRLRIPRAIALGFVLIAAAVVPTLAYPRPGEDVGLTLVSQCVGIVLGTSLVVAIATAVERHRREQPWVSRPPQDVPRPKR